MLSDLVPEETTEADAFENIEINQEVVEKFRTFIADQFSEVTALEVYIAMKLLISIAEEHLGITNVEFN